MYLVNTELTVNWILSATEKVLVLPDMRVLIQAADKSTSDISGTLVAENFLAPTSTTDGFLEAFFTPDETGLWVAVLVEKNTIVNPVYSEVKIFVTINDTIINSYVNLGESGDIIV